MIPSFCQDEIEVIRAPLIDERGAKVRDWANAKKHTISPCSVQPASTTSDTARRENVQVKMTAYMDMDADIEKFDRVKYNGEVFELDGAPYTWKSPSGQLTHKIASLISTDG